MRTDPFLNHIVSALVDVPGVEAIVLGGSRARGTSTDTSDYDIGLYYSAVRELDTDRLLCVATRFVDNPEAAEVVSAGVRGSSGRLAFHRWSKG